jgi:chorismate mutase
MDPEKLYAIKKAHGAVFTATVKNVDIVFRELTFSEYDKISEYRNSDEFSSADAEDLIINSAVVYPENFSVDKLPPGIVTSLAQRIIDVSGFYSAKLAKRTLEEKREKAGEVRNLMKAFVLATIPVYKPEDLDEMTFSQLSERVAIAEKIIEIKQAINGIEPTNMSLELIDPEEEEEKARQKAARHNLSRKDGEAEYEDPIAQKLWRS